MAAAVVRICFLMLIVSRGGTSRMKLSKPLGAVPPPLLWAPAAAGATKRRVRSSIEHRAIRENPWPAATGDRRGVPGTSEGSIGWDSVALNPEPRNNQPVGCL